MISLRSCRLWTFFVPMFKVVAKGVNYDWFSIVLWLEGHFQSGWCVYIEGTCLPWLYRLKMWYKLHSAHVNLLYKWSCKNPDKSQWKCLSFCTDLVYLMYNWSCNITKEWISMEIFFCCLVFLLWDCYWCCDDLWHIPLYTYECTLIQSRNLYLSWYLFM